MSLLPQRDDGVGRVGLWASVGGPASTPGFLANLLSCCMRLLPEAGRFPGFTRKEKRRENEGICQSLPEVFLSWTRPSPEDQKPCLEKSGSFNYDRKFKGATAWSASSLQEDKQLSEEGFLLNHARVLIGSGLETYERGKNGLLNWRHFQMNWTFVEPTTPVKCGVKFCVCVKELLPWLMMPLQVVYVNNEKRSGKLKASFSFGSGTLHGHLLAGEERFSVELDDDNQVWYEILSFSKPAHFLSFIGYPYVRFRQKCFAKESIDAVLKYLSTD